MSTEADSNYASYSHIYVVHNNVMVEMVWNSLVQDLLCLISLAPYLSI